MKTGKRKEKKRKNPQVLSYTWNLFRHKKYSYKQYYFDSANAFLLVVLMGSGKVEKSFGHFGEGGQ